MAGPVRERPPEVARAGGMDPRLTRAMGLSLAAHVAVVLGILLYSHFGPEPLRFEPPPGGPVVDLVTPRGDSKVYKVGPLAKAGGQKATTAEPPAPKPEPKVEAPKETAAPAKAEPPPPPKPAPEPEPTPTKPPEPKPDALPDPKIAAEKKLAEEKKLADEKKAAEQKKLAEEKKQAEEKKKVEEKKLAEEKKKADEKKLAEEKKKAEAEKLAAEKKKAEAEKLAAEKKQAEELAEAKRKAEEKKKAELAATTTPGDVDGTTSRAGPAGSGGGTATEPGSSGDTNGGGGGAGNRTPEFYAYYGYMIRTIKDQWVWVAEDSTILAAKLRFSILPDGSIADARISARSRAPHFDESILKAVRAVGKLSPPPAAEVGNFSDVELDFDNEELLKR